MYTQVTQSIFSPLYSGATCCDYYSAVPDSQFSLNLPFPAPPPSSVWHKLLLPFPLFLLLPSPSLQKHTHTEKNRKKKATAATLNARIPKGDFANLCAKIE